MKRMVLAGGMMVVAMAGGAPAAARQTASAPAAVDYANDASWLCRPGRADACAVDQAATVVAADGRLSAHSFNAAKTPAVDCFYVYPTVSTDPTPNSDMKADAAEKRVVEQQLARFASQCRVFAPLYRQATLSALRDVMMGKGMTADMDLAYRDVRAAWNDYLARDNGGRGVVLIGHSQGSNMLKRLVQEEIDGKPAQQRIVSAMLIGYNVLMPEGRDVGGDFKNMPLCRSASQTGCVVSYVSFRSDAPPPAASRFGRATPGMQVACTNPAALGGGKGALDAYLSNTAAIASSAAAPKPWAKDTTVSTPFVQAPGLLSAECVTKDGATYLAVTTNADPADPRTDEIAGDVVVGGKILPEWGLHLIDMNLAMGNLVDLVGSQAKAWRARR